MVSKILGNLRLKLTRMMMLSQIMVIEKKVLKSVGRVKGRVVSSTSRTLKV